MSRVRDWLAWRLFWVSCRLNHIRVATEVSEIVRMVSDATDSDAKHKGPQS